jgi:tetratricopeptide (TPR) repeat protein
VFNNRANTRYLLGDFPGAISDFTRAIRFDSNSSAPYANRGFAYLFSGDTIRACADWHKADEMGHPLSKGFIQLYCKN